ncbi:MAG: epoxyqueuosine reductase QueH [Syntrophomonadaceae bacterium]|nr:epoxyqueuosine reductase QueH [Syntrophomonadaceae bacterium]
MSKVLLHICCGPCATYPVPWLREQGHEVMGNYYNPNIHPYREYLQRKQALEEFARLSDLQVIYAQEYNPAEYFQSVSFRESKRCLICYQIRLEQAARIAKKGHFDYFTSTLLVSKFQKHEMIKDIGEAAAEKYGVPFLYQDFRAGFSDTVKISREIGLYRQQYCGCLYSEKERYTPKPRRTSNS